MNAHGVPTKEAAPVVFACCADLIRKAKTVGPAFLQGAPTAVPDEFVDVGFAGGMNAHDANEIGATGQAAHGNVFDGQVGLGGEHVSEQASDFHGRGEPFNLNAGRTTSRAEPANISFEGF